ncbi:19784_t:CDS:2 [Racocetra fulgida]|uniref:19784_t:CDS:1 n=1 Tax=Racocetra fulgida TaxID=60492 RepID=A0A9N9GUC8_9GLOM|nr:19784_t:CDS:2 [Racocetra fulgida]
MLQSQHNAISAFESGLEGQSPNILNSLKRDHDLLKSLYQEYNNAKSTEDQERIAKEIFKGVGIHDKIETLVFYPALRDSGTEAGNNYVAQSLSDHENVRSTLYELNVLIEDEGEFIEHSEVEEKEIFKFCRKIFDDKKIEKLGRELDAMRKTGDIEEMDSIEKTVV